ncbi:MAG: hypothetical protein M1833_006590 [Piccolia ochrophora]|nr:MAG: hypothetical protein M1833_006590 [Piccolia ochrophora]
MLPFRRFRSKRDKNDARLESGQGSLDDSDSELRGKAPEESIGLFYFNRDTQGQCHAIDIVAVHGLGGHWEKTWTDKNGKLWLRDFLPSQLQEVSINARIMSYGYNSKTAFSRAITNIDNDAEDLLNRLDNRRETEEERKRPILFIAHSLGGLVVKKALIIARERSGQYRNLLKSVQGCVFFGVPHRGSDIAFWVNYPAKLLDHGLLGLGGNTAYIDALKTNSSTWRAISKQFVERAEPLEIRTFYETERLGNVLIVDEESARLNLPKEVAVGVASSNHINMCKFNNVDSQRYEPVWKAVRKLAQEAIARSAPSLVSLSERETECLRCLYTSNYKEHKGRNPRRILGTCDWFLRHPQYLHWRDTQESNLLWVSASPGCGKSVLASYLVDELGGQESQKNFSGTVCYFFFKDDNDRQKSTTSALCAILYQFFNHDKSLIRYALPAFETKGEQMVKEFGTLWDILMTAAADENCGNLICIMDGLDECEELHRDMLLQALIEFSSGNESRTGTKQPLKILVTSRPYLSIENKLHDESIIRLKAEDETFSTQGDVEMVIRARIAEIGKRRHLSQIVQTTLVDRLIRNADRTFLWVSLVIEDIDRSPRMSKGALDELVENIPETLDSVYDKILQRTFNRSHARKLLHIVVAAARPLSLNEMSVAFVIKPHDRSYEDLDREPDIAKTITNLCGLFVKIIDSKIYLVHQTARAFLINDPGIIPLDLGTWKHSLRLVDAHLVLAEISIRYLLFPIFEEDSLEFESDDFEVSEAEISHDVKKHDFLHYAATWWVTHFRDADVTQNTALVNLALKLIDTQSKRFRTWFRLYQMTESVFEEFLPPGSSDLTTGSYLGLEDVVRLLLVAPSVDVTSKDDIGRTPLSWATIMGHEGVLRSLLAVPSVEVNSKDRDGQTPLSLAAERGHEGIVRLLLNRGAKHDSKDTSGQTPLSMAAIKGHEGVVRLLLDRGAKHDSKDTWGQTPLSWAAERGREGIVRLLLDRGAKHDSKDTWGRTPLSWAADRGHEGIVRLLLDRGAKHDSKDTWGRTPLSWAAIMGHEGVLRLLLAVPSVEVNSENRDGRTPLSLAAEREFEGVVRLLLDRGAKHDSVDQFGKTPLSHATERGHEKTVELLTQARNA